MPAASISSTHSSADPARELFLDLRDELRDAREPVGNSSEARIGDKLGAADDIAEPLPKPRIVGAHDEIVVLSFDRLIWRADSVCRPYWLRTFARAPIFGASQMLNARATSNSDVSIYCPPGFRFIRYKRKESVDGEQPAAESATGTPARQADRRDAL